MAEKLTPWFPGTVKPVHEGVYPRRFADGGRVYNKWDGRKWLRGGTTPIAANHETVMSAFQSLPWRGLAQDPSKEKV